MKAEILCLDLGGIFVLHMSDTEDRVEQKGLIYCSKHNIVLVAELAHHHRGSFPNPEKTRTANHVGGMTKPRLSRRRRDEV